MADPPRALKRVKKGEAEQAEAEIFSRPEVLQYQNKALASYLRSEKDQNAKLKQQISKLENKNSNLISCASLAYQQLFTVNDKLVTLLKCKDIDPSSLKDLRSSTKFTDNMQLFTSMDSDRITQAGAETKTIMEEAGIALSSMINSLSSTSSDQNGGTSADSSKIAKLTEELTKANSLNQQLQNKQSNYNSEIGVLKEKVEKLKEEAEEDAKKMQVLKLRADRYFPYVKFESKTFNIDIPTHE